MSGSANILIVEDDERIAKLLKQFLISEGFSAEVEHSAEEALQKIEVACPELIILDLMLPGMDGVEFCQHIRPSFMGGILMLTAHEGDMQEVIALNAGVDDFVSKPIRTHILLARIKAILRRQSMVPVGENHAESTVIQIEELVLDRAARKVFHNHDLLILSDSEFELMWYLVQNAGEVVTRDQLFQKLRGREYDGLDRSIDMRVSKLRKTLSEQCSGKQYIVTLRQRGYIFQQQPEISG